MLKYGEVNPLNVHGLRRLEHCPPHFLCVYFDLSVDATVISDWVYTNLSGRFYFADATLMDSAGKRTMQKVLAFEEHSEATYFGLYVDQINTPNSQLW